ncbi:aspartate/glutamate racemase family protein [Marinomonas sp. M1K-6]|uniref:Aspartate/glutamate racemase family protein n=1 Tax=Marinomonas profundi TaxID=2726122 RepID=A0A847QWG8_9GAMM|nr:aspartate/glutamate racemase family protein [Marinomonas profundi]NLQ17688.1 aspartate/glutamate racemase family protein [Marinomonas profundi]UDV04247.1 aspartate/glutamate racemase family protein [Marinomonas profundi]
MKTIGIIGGMSWESSALYYQNINELTKQQLGGLHSAKIILSSVDFADIERLQHQADWGQLGDILAAEAKRLEQAQADFILIATNTMHKVADAVQSAIQIPLLHIADATAKELVKQQHQKVAFIGTRYSMEEDFYIKRLEDQYGLDVITPSKPDRDSIHRVIYEELYLGKIRPESRAVYIDIVNRLQDAGAEAVIAGCTEITLLLKQEHVSVPLFDTAYIHAKAAVDEALNGF